MGRPQPRSQQIFTAVMVMTVALSLLPSNWLRSWTGDLSAIVSLPITPLAHAGGAVRSWLRPPRAPLPETPAAHLGDLVEELARYEQLYGAARLRIRELEGQVEHLQRLPMPELQVTVGRRTAAVIGRDLSSPVGLVELNRGRRHGINESAIALYGAGYLLGRVQDAGPLRSHLLPIANPASGKTIRAAIMPADLGLTIDAAPEVQLEPTGDGGFVAEVAKSHGVAIGDVVKLTDPRWPEAARARTIGTVTDVRTNDRSPLRAQLRIEPQFQPAELSQVVLIFEVEEAIVAGATP